MVLDYLVNIQNKVPEKQRFYQNNTKPLYVRTPRGNFLMRTWFTGLAIGLAGASYGAVQLILVRILPSFRSDCSCVDCTHVNLVQGKS
ncbi:hypothetical protein ACEPAH_5781 [Sanghuangporus vaninii]